MPRKKKVDHEKLIKAVESGKPSKEILAKFRINTLAQLKSHYIDALTAEGRITGIVAARRSRVEVLDKSKELRINKRGSLVVPREIIEEMGFNIGDSFSVRKTAAGVSLKRLR